MHVFIWRLPLDEGVCVRVWVRVSYTGPWGGQSPAPACVCMCAGVVPSPCPVSRAVCVCAAWAGQAAGAAAVLALRDKVAVQDVDIAALQAMQRANGVEPHYPPGRCPSA